MKQEFSPIPRIKSVLLIDNNEIDNFITKELLNKSNVLNVQSFSNANVALKFLKESDVRFDLILIEIYLPLINAFDFLSELNSFGLGNRHGQVILQSTFLNPSHKLLAEKYNVRFLEKPVTIEKLSKYYNST